jgi:hypothetical protein
MAKDRVCFPNPRTKLLKQNKLPAFDEPLAHKQSEGCIGFVRWQAFAKDRSCAAIEKDPLHLFLDIERRFHAPPIFSF